MDTKAQTRFIPSSVARPPIIQTQSCFGRGLGKVVPDVVLCFKSRCFGVLTEIGPNALIKGLVSQMYTSTLE